MNNTITNQEGVAPEVGVTKKFRGAIAPLIFLQKPLSQKSGYAPGDSIQYERTNIRFKSPWAPI